MYRVTVDGDTKVWGTLDIALTDLFTRGYDKDWTLEKVAVLLSSTPTSR